MELTRKKEAARRLPRRAVVAPEKEYTLKEAAEVLCRSRATVWRYIQQGLLEYRERRRLKDKHGNPRKYFLMCDLVDCMDRL